MKTLTATLQKGFTLLEIVLVMSVLGVLATVGLQTYSYQVAKARVVDAVVLMDGVRTDVLVDFISRSRFPGKIQEALASPEAGASQVHDSGNAVISQGKGAVDKYWYYGNDEQGIGWFAVELSPRVLPGCDSDCQLHLGFRKHNNRLEFHCGLWDGGNFPAGMLPTGCKETCVSCRLSTSDAGENALTAALNNPVVPPTPAGSSGPSGGNNSGGSNPENHNSDPEPDQDTDGSDGSEDNGSSSGPGNSDGNAEGSSTTESGEGSAHGPGNAYTAPDTGSSGSDDSSNANTGAQNGNHDDTGHGSSGSGNGGNGGGGSAGLPLTPGEGDHADESDSVASGDDDCEKPGNGRGNSNAGPGNNNAGGNDCRNPNAGPGNNSGNGNTDPGRGKGKGRWWS